MTSDLLTRLSKLGAPDREVDEEIHDLLCDGKFFSQLADAPLGQGCWMYNFPNGDVSSALYVTSSVDAAIELAERVLPGCDIETSDVHADFRGAKEPRHIADLSSDLVWEKYDGYPEPVYRIRGTGQSNIRAIALLIALLRAKEASNG